MFAGEQRRHLDPLRLGKRWPPGDGGADLGALLGVSGSVRRFGVSVILPSGDGEDAPLAGHTL